MTYQFQKLEEPRTLQKGETPTVDERGYYNEYIPPEMNWENHWPVGRWRMKLDELRLLEK